MIDNYLNPDLANFFDQTSLENQEWLWMTLEAFRTHFPQADHWRTGGETKKYTDIRIGKKVDGKKGSPVFLINREKGNVPFCYLHPEISKNISGYDHLRPTTHRTIDLIDNWLINLKDKIGPKKVGLENGNGNKPTNYTAKDDEQETGEVPASLSNESSLPLNQILFGPPGTGKTYSVIEEALRILDPEYLSSRSAPERRKELKERFDQLVKQKRIRFTTFHQSYSYEDFVEGMRATTNEEGDISYEIQSGLFKQLCEDASLLDEDPLNIALEKFREQLEATGGRKTLFTKNGNRFDVTYDGGNSFFAYPDSSRESKGYSITLRHLRTLYDTGSKKAVHMASYNGGLLEYLIENCGLPKDNTVSSKSSEKAKYVLIIDEINRGNISRIFGELITLIEPSKRAGSPEALTLKLLYSKEEFSVPDNVYLIGTMNTADRSLAGMDIALRRRFIFREMPPKPELLKDVVVSNVANEDVNAVSASDAVNIEKMLSAMNERIEVLLDKDHCIGHAYFMPLKSENTLANLSSIFVNQILPLLQEYFFEDWKKIAWVLNDHRKVPEYQFISQSRPKLSDFFGDRVAVEIGDMDNRWELNPAAFSKIQSYVQIIGASR